MAQNEAKSHFGLNAAGVEPDEMSSPMARWIRICEAKRNIPGFRNYLHDPRLEPKKVDQQARKHYLAERHAGLAC